MQTIEERESELLQMIDDLSDVAYTASHEMDNDVKNTLLLAVDALTNHLRLKVTEIADQARAFSDAFEDTASELGKYRMAELRESDEEDYRFAKYGR